MLIVLTHLPAEGLSFEHQYETGELDLSQREFLFTQAPNIKGRVTSLGVEMRMIGTLSAQLEVSCDRCLEPIAMPLAAEFDLFYLPEESSLSMGDEQELHDRELGSSFYTGDRIDVDELVLEQIELNLPYRLLCQEDCAGLCSQCGANLNEARCNCQPPIDPRWQALADLK